MIRSLISVLRTFEIKPNYVGDKVALDLIIDIFTIYIHIEVGGAKHNWKWL